MFFSLLVVSHVRRYDVGELRALKVTRKTANKFTQHFLLTGKLEKKKMWRILRRFIDFSQLKQLRTLEFKTPYPLFLFLKVCRL